MPPKLLSERLYFLPKKYSDKFPSLETDSENLFKILELVGEDCFEVVNRYDETNPLYLLATDVLKIVSEFHKDEKDAYPTKRYYNREDYFSMIEAVYRTQCLLEDPSDATYLRKMNELNERLPGRKGPHWRWLSWTLGWILFTVSMAVAMVMTGGLFGLVPLAAGLIPGGAAAVTSFLGTSMTSLNMMFHAVGITKVPGFWIFSKAIVHGILSSLLIGAILTPFNYLAQRLGQDTGVSGAVGKLSKAALEEQKKLDEQKKQAAELGDLELQPLTKRP